MTSHLGSAGDSRLPVPDSGAVLVPELFPHTGQTQAYGPGVPGRVSIRVLLRRQRWILAGGFGLAAIAFAILTFLVPATYESEVDFLVGRQDILARYDEAPTVDRRAAIPNHETEVELLQSRTVVEAVVKQLDLRAGFAFAPVGNRWFPVPSSVLGVDRADPDQLFLFFDLKPDAPPGTYRLDGEPAEFRVTDAADQVVATGPAGLMLRFEGVELLPAEQPLRAPVVIEVASLSETANDVRRRISARELKQSTDLIRLTCKGRTPASAHDLCSAVTSSYLELRATIQRSEAAAAAAFLREQSVRLQVDLEAAEDSVRLRREQLLGLGAASPAIAEDRQLARLDRRVSVLDERFRFVEARLREAEVAQAVDLPGVRLVDAASVPVRATSPSPPVNMAIGLFIFLGLGVAPAVHRERTDRRLRERESVVAAAGAPVLAMVPHLSAPSPVITVSLAGRPGETDITVAPEWTEEREVALEAFRTLAVDLRFVGDRLGTGRFQTVAVTSASSGEGKTFTAANLAIVRASHGTSTCLVDADLRAGGVQRFFEWPPMLGLSEVLTREAELRLVTRSARIAGRNPLSVVPSGALSPRSAELLEHRSFGQALSSLRNEYEFIVVDTPPLNVLPDAASVVAIVDAVVVVVRSGVTDRVALDRTLERLNRAGATIAGVVLNDAAVPRSYSSYTYAKAAKGREGRRG